MDFKEGVNIRVIYKGVGERPNRVEIPNSLTALRASIGGPVGLIMFAANAAIVYAVCDLRATQFPQEKYLPYNCSIFGRHWYGPLLLVGFDGYNFCSLTEEEMEAAENSINGE